MAYDDDVPPGVHERHVSYWIGRDGGGALVAKRARDDKAEDGDDARADDLPPVFPGTLDLGRGDTPGARRLAAAILADALEVSPLVAAAAIQSQVFPPGPEGRRARIVARAHRHFASDFLAAHPRLRGARISFPARAVRDWAASTFDSGR